MPDVNLQTSYVPFITEVLPNDGQTLEFSFTTLTDTNPQNPPPCDNTIKLSCNPEGITNLTEAIFEWVGECSGKRTVSSGDNYDYLKVELETDSGITTAIEIQVGYPILINRNLFRLWAVINDIKTLLARGIIYTDIDTSNIVGGIFITDDVVAGDVPSGAIDGLNDTYITTYSFNPTSVSVFLNGLLQQNGVDYTTSGANTITFVVPPLIGDIILVDYIRP